MAGDVVKDPEILKQALNLEPVALADWLIVMPVAWCIIIGAVLLMFRKRTDWQHLMAVPSMGVLVLITAALLMQVLENGTMTMVMGRWLPPFGIAFTVDILGALLAFTSAVVAFACTLYGVGDVNDTGRRYGFYPFLFMLMAGVSGAFLTGDIFNLYVWFEVLLISSFGLLILGSEKGQLDGATKYAFLNLVATTLFLIATGYLYGIFGTLNMAEIAVRSIGDYRSAPLGTLAVLYFVAFAMKAAAFPVNFWLPASYHTPRVVVSALFAGLLTKVGIYAMIRVLIMLLPFERDLLSFPISYVACATMLLGAIGALAQVNIRRALGFLVVSGIGVMMMGVAIGTEAALGGAIFYAMHSILVMTALYLAVGLASRAAGGVEGLDNMRGIYQKNTFIAALTLMLFFAVAGLPPFSGFWPKLMLVKATIEGASWWAPTSILVTGFISMIAVGRIWALSYWQPEVEETIDEEQIQLSFIDYAPLVMLTAIVVAIGVYPQPIFEMVYAAANQLIDPTSYYESVFGSEVAQ
ncbi:Na+/H+ antiporter subunit D [Lentilitoribacter sp. EG35]|uniref:Na+/H+ antiporter subunit D n=1 Tax=Lentilitoribacter sp. EG35 TaxID=3234192 RepID=UPI00346113B8